MTDSEIERTLEQNKSSDLMLMRVLQHSQLRIICVTAGWSLYRGSCDFNSYKIPAKLDFLWRLITKRWQQYICRVIRASNVPCSRYQWKIGFLNRKDNSLSRKVNTYESNLHIISGYLQRVPKGHCDCCHSDWSEGKYGILNLLIWLGNNLHAV